jgi:hypothetical protein
MPVRPENELARVMNSAGCAAKQGREAFSMRASREPGMLLGDSGRSAPAEDRQVLTIHDGCLTAGPEMLVTGTICYFHLVGKIGDLLDANSYRQVFRAAEEQNF